MPNRLTAKQLVDVTASQLRDAIRAGRWSSPTAGLARGHAQANLVVVPATQAEAFAEFCRLNDRACPLLEQTRPGHPVPQAAARTADLRVDLPRYRVFRQGVPDAVEPTDIRAPWRDDLVGFLLGCSFTFENALVQAGLPVRHLDEGRNVPMYRTSQTCRPAGPFRGNLVVSMRPYPPELVEQVIAVTSRFPTMHGAPVHVGDPATLGIGNLSHPDFGDAVSLRPGEVPVFWACGVTPQLALLEARLDLAITHSPGCMFVTDWYDSDYERPHV